MDDKAPKTPVDSPTQQTLETHNLSSQNAEFQHGIYRDPNHGRPDRVQDPGRHVSIPPKKRTRNVIQKTNDDDPFSLTNDIPVLPEYADTTSQAYRDSLDLWNQHPNEDIQHILNQTPTQQALETHNLSSQNAEFQHGIYRDPNHGRPDRVQDPDYDARFGCCEFCERPLKEDDWEQHLKTCKRENGLQ